MKLVIRDFNLSLSHISLKLLPYFVSGSENPHEDNTETSASHFFAIVHITLSSEKLAVSKIDCFYGSHIKTLLQLFNLFYTPRKRLCLINIHHYGLVRCLKFSCLHFTLSSNQQAFQISSRLVTVIPMVDPLWWFNLITNTKAVLCVSLKCLTMLLFNQDILDTVD